MTPEEPNERVKSLIADMEKIGARPAYLRGGSYNDYLEYGRLKDLIAKECIEAFKAGFRFEKEATPRRRKSEQSPLARDKPARGGGARSTPGGAFG